MDTDEEIRDRIERSFGDGPPLPQADVLAAGQRALRRRRRAIGAATAVAVLAVVGTTAVATGRTSAGPGPTSPPVAGTTDASPSRAVEPSPSARPSASPRTTPPTRAEISRALSRGLATFDVAGHLRLVPGARVVRRLDNPYRLTAPATSLGLEVDYRGGRYWFALDRSAEGGSGSVALYKGDARSLTFEAWVQAQKPLADTSAQDSTVGPDVWPGEPTTYLVRFSGSAEELEPVGRVQILRQRPHVSVGASFAGPTDRTAAALVRATDGKRYYVLARHVDGSPAEYIAMSEEEGGPTLAAFLDFARTRYAEGGGGLL